MSGPATLSAMRAALYRDAASARAPVGQAFAPDAVVRLCFPFETSAGGAGFWSSVSALLDAWPDLERREHIVIGGHDADGAFWVGCCGAYVGTFSAPFLNIPPTGRAAHMRFHEFFRIEGERVVEMQAIWDIPEVMMQAGVWPLGPGLGRDGFVPGPATQDGLGPHDPAPTAASVAHVIDMISHLSRHPSQGGPQVMRLEHFWHPNFMWYGPAGIGTTRGIAGFRRDHQIPFLSAMPDRGQRSGDVRAHFIAQGHYVGVTGWPNMKQTLSGGGWLGIAPTGQVIEMRSLDFWRLEAGLIRENWVLVDLLSVYDQIGVDVFARMKELTVWTSG
ncbi:MAG: ester cyclase [Rhodobacter sp.]|nr:ester cyclase [Rhodobacter sp.]